MTIATRALLLLATVAVLNAGCGSSAGTNAANATETKSTATQISTATLKTGVRAALNANLELSLYVLWHNRIPVWATGSTRGPALQALRSAATTRRQQGIQIKNLSGRQTIVSITLAPSYSTAIAVVRDQRRVAPYKSGHRLGKAITGTENSRVQLHRLGNTRRFVVWRVSPIR